MLVAILLILSRCVIGVNSSSSSSSGSDGDPPGYICKANSDVQHACDITRAKGNLSELATQCDTLHKTKECWGFNANGYLKRCMETSCGGRIVSSSVFLCIRKDIPTPQPVPKGCAPSPPPTPHPHAPTPAPHPPPLNCSGQKPPFGPPAHKMKLRDDWHYPPEEPKEQAGLVFPVLVRSNGNTSAVLRLSSTGQTATVDVGSVQWGWHLYNLYNVGQTDLTEKSHIAVLEYAFKRWAAVVYLQVNQSLPFAMFRKPVGKLSGLEQPLYFLNKTDPDYECKQDVDPTDWLARIMADLSPNGEEPTFESALTVMAPNPDNGIIGNPEELNKFLLTDHGDLETMHWNGKRYSTLRKNSHENNQPPAVGAVLVSIRNYLLPGCPSKFPNIKGGYVGRYFRVMNTAMWDPASNCGAEIVAVSPFNNASNPVSTCLLRVTSMNKTKTVITYLRARAQQVNSTLIGLDNLGNDGQQFYQALLAQAHRWDAFVSAGALPTLPSSDRRYSDTALALNTQYMNTFRGLTPEYGGGKFWNLYNEYLPLDTLALNGALLEWGQQEASRRYLKHFFHKYMNASTGKIIYGPFGCDSDADYGRLIQTYAKAVWYSGNITWAQDLLPIIEAMVQVQLDWRNEAVAEYPLGNPFHGIIRGSPEHDICGGRGHFFSVNVWCVRGMLELHQLLEDFPTLTHNKTLEALLLPTANQWRHDIQFAANYTAVTRTDGKGLYFLHPCVGSQCSTHKNLTALKGGDEKTCVARGTCFASMTYDRNNQLTNYANFRIFSETLLASGLDPEYEAAIMNFRESHRGTLTGMTRFREVLDDMPVLGYGWSALYHDRVPYFHTLLAGHAANYISRGTFWGAEERAQLGISDSRWRNCCGPGGEHGSLCMVSAVSASMWIRWMLVQDDLDAANIYLARGAPRRWYQQSQPFGISAAPTRFGLVSYSLRALSGPVISGSVTLSPNPGTPTKASRGAVKYVVHVRAPDAKLVLKDIAVSGAKLLVFHAGNETAVFAPTKSTFTFNATFHSG